MLIEYYEDLQLMKFTYLLFLEHLTVKMLLQLFIGEVNAQLLKRVVVENLKSENIK